MSDPKYRADAVIIGGGLAGIAAALELLDRGRSAVLLERSAAPGFGGLAKTSFGGIFIVGSPEQRRAGIKDSPDLAYRDWISYGQLDDAEMWPVKWAESYTAQCLEYVYHWLRQRKVRFFPVVNWVERGLNGDGNSVPRFHIVWGTGEGLIKALTKVLQDHPNRNRLTLCYSHRVDTLNTLGSKYSGCSGVIETTGESFSAEGEAVVIASGGIAGNHELVRRWWDSDLGQAPEVLLNGSSPNADGRLTLEMRSRGAAITHLDRMWNYAAGVRHWRPGHPNHGLSLVPPKSALWLNSKGNRIGPRGMVTGFDTRYLVERICAQEKKYSWQVLNMKIALKELAVSGAEFNAAVRDRRLLKFLFQLLAGNKSLVQDFINNCEDFVTARSLDELADKMNALTGENEVDRRVLKDTVENYDAEIDRGKKYFNDDQLRLIAQARRYRGDRVRTCSFAKILDQKSMPLIAIREHILTRKSLGGIQTDLKSRVLDLEGKPMAGLYAVGEAAGFGGGGIHGRRSLEGTFLGGCIFSGRLAGMAISEEL